MKRASVLFPQPGEPALSDKLKRVFGAMGGYNESGDEVAGIGNRIENIRDSVLGVAGLENTFPLIGRKTKMPRKLLPGERPSGGLRYPPGWHGTATQADVDSRIAEGQDLARMMHGKQAETGRTYRRATMNSTAFTLGESMAKEAVPLFPKGVQRNLKALRKQRAVGTPAVAAEEQTRGFFPKIREAVFGPKPKPGLLGGLGGAGKLGLLAAGGLGLWNTARTGSPFRHDKGVGIGGMMGSGARSIAQNDPLAQFGGMEPASANYWDQVTMAALQREAQSQNALERIRMLRRLGTGA